jgi:hypothetical protein
MQVICKAFTRKWLAAAWANAPTGPFAGPLHGSFAALITAVNANVDENLTAADLTEATYTGYVRQPMVMPTTTYDEAGTSVEGACGMLTWQPTGAAVSEMVVGVAYFDALTAGNLLGYDPLPSPGEPMGDVTNGFSTITVLDLPFDAQGESVTVI